jgi:raffinose/stachyose/melibiose transport system permease protein
MTVSNKKSIKKYKWFLFVVPALIFYLCFTIIPALSSVYYSLTNWDGGLNMRFIGFANFVEMFHDSAIWTSFGNTILYSVCITIAQNSLGLALALLMVKKIRGVNILRAAFFLPAIFSSLLIGFVWGYILEPNSGTLNTILQTLHLESFQRAWLGDIFWAKFMIILVTVWQFAGYAMVIYIAGLQAIPEELYEAADIDGASRFKRFINISFPLLASSFTINIILCTIGGLKSFDSVYALTGGGPGYATETMATMIYHLGFGGNGSRWGYGTAMSIVMFIFILILTSIQVTYLRKREVL